MEGPAVKNLLLAAACNAEYDCFDWRGEYVAFGSSDLVHVYHTKSTKTLCAIKGHIGRVNSVKFLQNGDILSACSNGRVCVFRNTHFASTDPTSFLQDEPKWTEWKCIATLDLKERNILQLGLHQSKERTIAVCLTTESDLHLIRIDGEKGTVVQLDKLIFGTNLLEASTIFCFKGTTYMCVSSSDFLVHTYSINVPETTNAALDGKSFTFLNSFKGHEDKVKTLDSVVVKTGSAENAEEVALIASGSKDSYVRVWRVTEKLTDKIQQEFIKKNIYKIGAHFCHLESVLHSHSDAVSSVQWAFYGGDKSQSEDNLVLLSSSFDFSVQIWQREIQSKVWMNVVRLGQLGGNKNSFFGAKFNSDTKKILSCTFTGCFYLWEQKETFRDWEPICAVTGHSRHVSDLSWGNNSDFIVSTSLDQTSRIYAPWNNPLLRGGQSWHEVSRAQVHGYDINAIKFLSMASKKTEKDDNRNLCSLLVCGADEKILRLLEPPAHFVNTINYFTDSKLRLYFPERSEEAGVLEDKEKFIYKTKTEGGYNVLGLLVKAAKVEKVSYYIKEDDEDEVDELENNFDIPYDYKTPPIEDFLFKHTLWPEINKFYGHGYEIVSLDTSPDGKLVASSCKSQTATHSSIFIWNPNTCQVQQKLEGHNYTVLQLKFSQTGKYLAAVSRDRQTSVFLRNDMTGQFENIYLQTTHSKLIYCLAISCDEQFLVAGSRDKSLRVWKLSDKGLTDVSTLKFPEGVRSVEFGCEPMSNGAHPLWIGLENGQMLVYGIPSQGESKQLLSLDGHFNHSGPVTSIKCGKKLARSSEKESSDKYIVASGGEDHSLRLYEYSLPN
jgi:elongator complex protein 2